MTGRAAGYCAGFATPGFANPAGFGRGMGRGVGGGMGFGFRNRFYAPATVQAPPISVDQEKGYLAHEAKALENDLEAIKERLNELNDK
jgi:hypothetical protein